MKKILQSLTLAVMLVALAACGGGKKKVPAKTAWELTPMQTEVKGYLSGVLAVVEGTYKFECVKDQGLMSVKIKSVSRGNPNDEGFSDGNWGPLYIAICDSLGAPIVGYEEIPSGYKADGLLKDMVAKVGDENWISFEMLLYGKNQLPDNTAQFYVFSKSKDGVHEASGAGSPEWDKLLDEFERYVNSYAAAVRKAASGKTAAAISECNTMLEKVESLNERLEAAKDSNVSNIQARRLADILSKLSDAEMQMAELDEGAGDSDDLFGDDEDDEDW